MAIVVVSVRFPYYFSFFNKMRSHRAGPVYPFPGWDRLRRAMSNLYPLLRFSRFCILLFPGAFAAWPQVASGTITGNVEDPSGAAIVGAQVAMKHIATGETRTTVTNEHGEFNAPFLHLGEYSVTVSAPNFIRQTLSGVDVRVDQTVNLQLKLELGATTQSVEVTGAAPLIDSVTSSLGQVIGNTQ